MTDGAGETLGCLQAIFEAVIGRPIAYFPRSAVDPASTKGGHKTLADRDVIAAIEAEIDTLAVDDGRLDDALKLARESINEVTKHTDYQDGKATRLLTILTFMSAFSGLLFNRLADGYPLSAALAWNGTQQIIASVLVIASYSLFAAFALLATSGALVTFHAIRSRFRYPRSASAEHPGSLVFWMPISWTQPKSWAQAFVDPDSKSKIAPNLKVKYLRNYVVETYLIGVKVADKVRFLEPAQRLQSSAIKALFFWIIATALVFVFVPPAKKASNSLIRIETPSSSMCITAGSDGSTTATVKPCDNPN
ncbi:hypothetical protein HFN11_29190 [Rhizobium leguminosarum]|uniref:hypothetical protein n=1 Tax=Rhizobium leguminosarum TaxID=384 RepID=UPI001C93D683|nr:hypothetical protein [Rhizobium leguminosarum]MBY5324339.1 hypothetical protein [Rhizobium leguminosarum]